jgi:hypothetical protein
VVKARRQALGIRKRQLEFAGQFIHSHSIFLNFDWVARERPGYSTFEGSIPNFPEQNKLWYLLSGPDASLIIFYI